jgi:hypothetical protein
MVWPVFGNTISPAEGNCPNVPSVRVKRMVIHIVKPIPMEESGSPRITIARLCGEEITLTTRIGIGIET